MTASRITHSRAHVDTPCAGAYCLQAFAPLIYCSSTIGASRDRGTKINNASWRVRPPVGRARIWVELLVYLDGRCIKSSLMYSTPVDCPTAHVLLSPSHMSFRTFQESDAEKSDQDLVVDVANEVRDCH